jgi:transposase-like protein
LAREYDSDNKCREYLEELAWPDGVRCPRCKSEKISRIEKRHQYDCDSCRYQFSVMAGSVFHDSHLPLWKWFAAVYLMCESKKGMSANQIKRTLQVSYKTAWYLCHRIRAAMKDVDQAPLVGVVEADETRIGGRAYVGKGHYHDTKAIVLGAIQRGGPVRLRVANDVQRKTLHGFVRENVDLDNSKLYTDDWTGYKGLPNHETVNHRAKEWVRADVHTNTVEGVWSLFKRSVVGSYHQLSEKHLQSYLDEHAFRFNNRKNPYLFRDTLKRLLSTEPLPFEKLIKKTAA